MANKHLSKVQVEKDMAAQKGLLPPPQKHTSGAQTAQWDSLRKKVAFILPFVWPVGKWHLQLRVIAAFVLLFAIRVVSVLVPIYSKRIVNEMTSIQVIASITDITNSSIREAAASVTIENNTLTFDDGEKTLDSSATVPFPWVDILIFITLRSLRGGAGFLNCLRSLLFIQVTQHAQKALRLRLFAHLHSLSLRWHLHRKTGEVIKVMDRGVDSVSKILSHVQANLMPIIIDIIIAIVYFAIASEPGIALILLVTMVSYLFITIVMSEWRKKFRRKMNEADNQRNASGVDSILNFETVKYFSAESWEAELYAKSIDQFQQHEFLVNITANFLGTLQNLIMSLGLLGGCLLSAWYVHRGQFRVGDYVLFLTYVHQLYEPLDLFGAYYRILQQAVVDMENMFDMLSEQEEVQDRDGSTDLQLQRGQIEFDKVFFSYIPSKPLLRDLSFIVPPGETYALVGLSGSGKTTITRLIMRFYDIQSGTIRIDQQDISQVTQRSIRQHIGVVPQDTGLFNHEVRYNIRYGRMSATDLEVEEAARVADIHDRIVNLVDGYDSRIGERGLKLSGGEKQRIAIARTVLKDPEIVLLDEATSALDTQTERHIQASLARVCENRTTLIVAHRLSTVIHAHQILVLEEGTVKERGRHEELIAAGGLYSQMWLQQQSTSSRNAITSKMLLTSAPTATLTVIPWKQPNVTSITSVPTSSSLGQSAISSLTTSSVPNIACETSIVMNTPSLKTSCQTPLANISFSMPTVSTAPSVITSWQLPCANKISETQILLAKPSLNTSCQLPFPKVSSSMPMLFTAPSLTTSWQLALENITSNTPALDTIPSPITSFQTRLANISSSMPTLSTTPLLKTSQQLPLAYVTIETPVLHTIPSLNTSFQIPLTNVLSSTSTVSTTPSLPTSCQLPLANIISETTTLNTTSPSRKTSHQSSVTKIITSTSIFPTTTSLTTSHERTTTTSKTPLLHTSPLLETSSQNSLTASKSSSTLSNGISLNESGQSSLMDMAFETQTPLLTISPKSPPCEASLTPMKALTDHTRRTRTQQNVPHGDVPSLNDIEQSKVSERILLSESLPLVSKLDNTSGDEILDARNMSRQLINN